MSEHHEPLLIKIDGEAIAMGRPRASVIAGRAHVYQPQKSQDYKSYVRIVAGRYMQWYKPFEGPIELEIEYRMPIPQSMTKKNRLLALAGELFPAKKPDIDNLIKLTLDAMNSVVWHDDSQIVSIKASKVYAEKPCTNVVIKEAISD